MASPTELQKLRDYIAAYTPGKESVGQDVKKKAPQALTIAFFGPSGHGKSSIINTLMSAYRDVEPLNYAPIQSMGKHGTNEAVDYQLTPR
jgi:putative ribosome biogenesis GTPase RsgA